MIEGIRRHANMELDLGEVISLLKSIDAKLSQGSSSSVEIKSTAHGPDITVKAYTGSSVIEAGDMAMLEWRRIHEQFNQAGVEAFATELDRRKSS